MLTQFPVTKAILYQDFTSLKMDTTMELSGNVKEMGLVSLLRKIKSITEDYGWTTSIMGLESWFTKRMTNVSIILVSLKKEK